MKPILYNEINTTYKEYKYSYPLLNKRVQVTKENAFHKLILKLILKLKREVIFWMKMIGWKEI